MSAPPIQPVPAREPLTNERDCVLISQVAPGWPAHHVGLRPGDLICRVGFRPAVEALGETYDPPPAPQTHVVQCYKREEGSYLSFTVHDGIALGVSVTPTVAAATAALRRGVEPNWHLLYLLWQESEWELLLHFSTYATELANCRPCLTSSGRRLCCKANWSCGLWRLPDPVGHCCALAESKQKLDTPGLVMQGAAMLELGWPEGLRLVRWFAERYESHHTTNFHAVARLYLARHDSAHRPDADGPRGAQLQDGRVELLEEASRLFGERDTKALAHLRRLAAEMGLDASLPAPAATDAADPAPATVPFPPFGNARALVSSGRWAGAGTELVSLKTLLADVQPEQQMLVVLLGSYRANGPYYQLLREVIVHARALQPAGLLGGCVVLTCHEAPDTGGRWSVWAKNEKRMQDEQLNLLVLHLHLQEYSHWESELQRRLEVEIEASPYCLLMGQDGGCRPVPETDELAVELSRSLDCELIAAEVRKHMDG